MGPHSKGIFFDTVNVKFLAAEYNDFKTNLTFFSLSMAIIYFDAVNTEFFFPQIPRFYNNLYIRFS